MARYRRDPRWIEARFGSPCAGCSEPIEKGAQAYYVPLARKTYCRKCGEPMAARFEAEAWDEDQGR